MNERFYALRSVVPNVSRMDKVSPSRTPFPTLRSCRPRYGPWRIRLRAGMAQPGPLLTRNSRIRHRPYNLERIVVAVAVDGAVVLVTMVGLIKAQMRVLLWM